MNLENPTRENLDYMINELKVHLKLVNTSIIDPEEYHMENYEKVYDIYTMVNKKQGRLSMMELEGVLQELGSIRKSKN